MTPGMKTMVTHEEIDEARKVLDLPERATMGEIKSSYRRLLRKWHPDRCMEQDDRCAEMTKRIVAAYETVMAYCRHYRYSFTVEEFSRIASDDDWWMRRFGTDPLWGDLKKRK